MKITQDGVLRKQVELLFAQGNIAVLSGAGVALLAGLYFWQVTLFYDPTWASMHQVVLFMVIAGLAAGSVTTHSAVLEVYVLFLIPLLLPLEVGLLIRGDGTTSYFGGVLLIFAISMLLVARRSYLQMVDTIHLSIAQQFLQEEVSAGTRELKLAQRALHTSEHRFGQILESSLDGFWEWDIANNQLYLSPRWKAQLGFAEDELVNDFGSFESRLHADDRDGIIQKIQAYLMKPWGNWEEEFRLQHKNGSYRWILSRATPTFDVKDVLVKLTGVHIDITERVEAEGRAKHLAFHDWLTQLPNRVLFNDRVDHAIAGARRTGQRLSILFFDLDRFKHINDSLGHPAGDRVLERVARRLKRAVREGDTLARLGGDEFAVLIENAPHAQDIAVVAEKLLSCFEKPFALNGYEFYLNASIGITVYPRDGESTAELLKNADAAMYKAKNKGRGGFQFYTEELTSNAYQHITLESGLRQALRESQFLLHYQPKVCLRSGRPIGVEALLRWRDDKAGLVSPEDFIPVAEESGLIREIGEWVLSQACRDAMRWREQQLDFGHVAVNLSGVQVQHEAFVDTIKQILQDTGMETSHLELEITENFLMKDVTASARYLQDLRRLGVSIAIDDFGTGYSSLSHLTRLPIDKLKIDRSFVSKVCKSSQDDEISRIIIGLGHTLGMKVVAEGIENRRQLQFLRQEGCDEGQGYFIARPLTNEDFVSFVSSYKETRVVTKTIGA
ncbi:MAG: EAL domain-containing protein [Candidatus Thiodiazotropha sp.]